MKKYSYCHIITNLEKIGGAEGMLLRLIDRYSNEDVLVISLMKIDTSIIERFPSNIKFVSLGSTSAFSMFWSIFNLSKIVPNDSYVYCWMYHANVIGALTKILKFGKINLFWGVRHSLDDYQGESVSTKVAIQVGRLLKWIPSRVIFCSQRAQSQHEEFGYARKKTSIYIPNGYVFSQYQNRDFSSSSIVFGTAGRFHDAKDYRTLICAISPLLKQMPEAKLIMCGRDISESNYSLMKLVKQYDINKQQISLLGQVNDMSQFYNCVDIFILSSKTEGFPNVLAEAASHGCAVFSTDVGDAAVIVNNKSHIIPVSNPTALTKAIEHYISLPGEVRANIAFSTTQHVRSNFSISQIAERFFELGR